MASVALQTQDFLNMEFAFKYDMWELLRHEKFPETHAPATLLTGNALLFNGKKISCISVINMLFQNSQIFGGVRHTSLMAIYIKPVQCPGFQKQKFWNKLSIHDNCRIFSTSNRLPVYIAVRFWVSRIYPCLSNSHIPYLKANYI